MAMMPPGIQIQTMTCMNIGTSVGPLGTGLK
jgi:hypothetical protein